MESGSLPCFVLSPVSPVPDVQSVIMNTNLVVPNRHQTNEPSIPILNLGSQFLFCRLLCIFESSFFFFIKINIFVNIINV